MMHFSDPIWIKNGIFFGMAWRLIESTVIGFFYLLTHTVGKSMDSVSISKSMYSFFSSLYIDDLKILASNAIGQDNLQNINSNFSRALGLELGIDKCAIIHVERGKVALLRDIVTSPILIIGN